MRAAAPPDVQMPTRAGTRARLSCRNPSTALRVKGLPCSMLANAFSASVWSDTCSFERRVSELVGVEVEVGGQNGEEASEGLSKF